MIRETPSNDLQRLIERIEGATGPCIMLDRDIALAVYPGAKSVAQTDARISVWDGNGRTQLTVKPYTGLLDAATTLVPEGCGWLVGWGQTRDDEPMGGAQITRHARFIGHSANYDTIADAEASTPALALCAAALRARITQEQSNGMG